MKTKRELVVGENKLVSNLMNLPISGIKIPGLITR